MSITFLCLVQGEPITQAFAIDINSNMLISYLKKAIKSELYPQFDNVPFKDIKLWKVEIPKWVMSTKNEDWTIGLQQVILAMNNS
ncbi:22858_t:CDS:2 [Dentiscutata erythropus]|uniref:22858_t:CDS:1 n=1 Tax=Dentiscutata erythropus TaxID=1348616 RepID=A0A9N9F6V7_9GLOM|nr:22858_t:CDS:2 [Dentiscutata erythropus]